MSQTYDPKLIKHVIDGLYGPYEDFRDIRKQHVANILKLADAYRAEHGNIITTYCPCGRKAATTIPRGTEEGIFEVTSQCQCGLINRMTIEPDKNSKYTTIPKSELAALRAAELFISHGTTPNWERYKELRFIADAEIAKKETKI